MHGWLNMQSTWRTHGENQPLMPDDHRIFEIAVDLIRSASMKHEHWRVTALATVHKLPTLPIVLQGEECVIIATAFPDGDWYAWTTRRLLAHCEGVDHEMLSRDAMEADFGMFKGSPELMTDPLAPIQSLVATIWNRSGNPVRFRYECGYASMAPIQCHKYWTLKHSLLDKLMTPSELEEYKCKRATKN